METEYKEFEPWMIGKLVRNKSDGDVGITKNYEFVNKRIWVDWKTGLVKGSCMWVDISEIEFIDADGYTVSHVIPTEIEYMGRRYILKED